MGHKFGFQMQILMLSVDRSAGRQKAVHTGCSTNQLIWTHAMGFPRFFSKIHDHDLVLPLYDQNYISGSKLCFLEKDKGFLSK